MDYDRNRSLEREITLEVMDEKKPKNSLGMTDPRLFTGETKIYAVQDPHFMNWGLKQSQGVLPEPLRQRFSSIRALTDFVKSYYATRNIKVTKVD